MGQLVRQRVSTRIQLHEGLVQLARSGELAETVFQIIHGDPNPPIAIPHPLHKGRLHGGLLGIHQLA